MKLFATLIVYLKRSLFYIQAVQFFLIFSMRFSDYDLFYQCLFLVIIVFGSIAIGYIDMKLKILEKEQSIFNRENLELKQILNEIQNLRKDFSPKTIDYVKAWSFFDNDTNDKV